jgi:pimeloyl-ACP methyl ester carboxylesterase
MSPLVLLPGMMCDGRLFGPQIAAFGDRTLHLAPMVGAVTVQALAAQILADAPPRFALAGLSMGGIVAMEIMAQAPCRVTHLALLDTNPRAEMPEVQARRAPQIAKVQAGGLEVVIRDEMKPNYLTDGPNRGAILDLCMDMALTLGPKAFVNQSLALRDRPDQQTTLSRVTVPTLILCGRQDTLCPVERHEFMHALIPHSTLHIVEDAGHLPTLEQPDLTTAALRHWLEA